MQVKYLTFSKSRIKMTGRRLHRRNRLPHLWKIHCITPARILSMRKTDYTINTSCELSIFRTSPADFSRGIFPMTRERAALHRAGPRAAGILHDNDGTRAPTGMIRQSIVRGIVGVQKRRAKSACDATAMLRFFRARCGVRSGATTGCALFPASVLCFPAVDPLHCRHTRIHVYTFTYAYFPSPCRSPSSPSLSRRTCPQTNIFRIFVVSLPLSLSPPPPFLSLFRSF